MDVIKSVLRVVIIMLGGLTHWRLSEKNFDTDRLDVDRRLSRRKQK
jgi:hypothetical protein